MKEAIFWPCHYLNGVATWWPFTIRYERISVPRDKFLGWYDTLNLSHNTFSPLHYCGTILISICNMLLGYLYHTPFTHRRGQWSYVKANCDCMGVTNHCAKRYLDGSRRGYSMLWTKKTVGHLSADIPKCTKISYQPRLLLTSIVMSTWIMWTKQYPQKMLNYP